MMQQGFLQYTNQPNQAYQNAGHQSYSAQQQQQLFSMQQQQHQQQHQQQQHHHHQINPNQQYGNQAQSGRFYKRETARYDSQQSQSQPSQQSQQVPTKVVSLRNIPGDITDLQVALIGLQFGDVVNILYIKAKGQALIDLANVSEASEMIKFFKENQTDNLKGIEAAHSSYQQLTIDNTNRAQQTMNTVQLAKQLKEASVNGGDGFVVKALVTNIVYPICIDALYQVFSKFGNVLKIVLIQKNELGALIQMKDEIQAQQAIHNLNGRNMYNTYTGGCNILNLQVSKHKTIDVKSNNSKSWDYTNPLLPNLELRGSMNGQGNGNDPNLNKNINDSHHPLLPMPMNMAAAAAAGHHPGAYNSSSPYMTAQTHHQHAQGQAGINSGSLHHNQAHGSYQAAAAAAAAAVAQSVTGYPMQVVDGRSAVVQIQNFPDQLANPDALFTLFGVYGDILKVKIMYNRRDNALMQYKTYEQAFNAVSKMDKVKLFDKIISVGLSKFPEIQIPLKNDGGLAKDYSTSPLHRFKKPGSKNFFNIYPPNVTLHLSNIAPMTTQEQINELFTKYGTIKNFKWISKEGNKMA